MKVKVLQLDDRCEFPSDEEKEKIGKIFNALQFEDSLQENEKYKKMYALELPDGIWFIPAYFCEVVEEHTFETEQAISKNANFPNGILLVEDGSVDIDKLEEDGFYVISYRQGSEPPKFL